MRALTIRQPWAGAIAHQTKRVENRTWKLPAKYEGARILIHAAARPRREGVWRQPRRIRRDRRHRHDHRLPLRQRQPGLLQLLAQPGLYHWELADVTALPEPVSARGALGFWTVDEETVNAALRQDTEVAW